MSIAFFENYLVFEFMRNFGCNLGISTYNIPIRYKIAQKLDDILNKIIDNVQSSSCIGIFIMKSNIVFYRDKAVSRCMKIILGFKGRGGFL